MYKPVPLGQLHLLPEHTLVRVLGELDGLGQVLRTVTGEIQLVCTEPLTLPSKPQVELWGEVLQPTQLLVHGLQPLAPQVAALPSTALGPFSGPVRVFRYGSVWTAQTTDQRFFHLDWLPGNPLAPQPGLTDGECGVFHVQGKVTSTTPATLTVTQARKLLG